MNLRSTLESLVSSSISRWKHNLFTNTKTDSSVRVQSIPPLESLRHPHHYRQDRVFVAVYNLGYSVHLHHNYNRTSISVLGYFCQVVHWDADYCGRIHRPVTHPRHFQFVGPAQTAQPPRWPVIRIIGLPSHKLSASPLLTLLTVQPSPRKARVPEFGKLSGLSSLRSTQHYAPTISQGG